MSSRARTKVGVVGLGPIGEQHLKAYLKLPECEIVGVTDLVDSRRRVARERYGVATYATLPALLAEVRPEIVSICTPDFAHVEPAIEAARAGAHVFCEKPLAMDLPGAEAIVAACEQSGVRLGIGFKMRFERIFAQAKWYLARGAIGEPQVAYLSRPQRANLAKRYPVEVLAEFGDLCHEIDMASWFLDDEPESVFEEGVVGYGGRENPTRVLVAIRYRSGKLATLYVGTEPDFPRTGGLYDAKFHVIGTKGYILGERPDRLLICNEVPPFELRVPRIDVAEYWQAAFDREIAAFVAAIRSDEMPPVTGQRDGMRAVRVSAAARESLATRRPVNVLGGT